MSDLLRAILRCSTDIYPVREAEWRELACDPSFQRLVVWKNGKGRGYTGSVGHVDLFMMSGG